MSINLNWPLMENNITADDRRALIRFLETDPILTQSRQVASFEEEWSAWLGTKYSVFVNSGASANLLSIATLKHTMGTGEIIIPPLTWVSDIASVLHYGFTPVFADINLQTLSMDTKQVIQKLNKNTKAVFLTHAQGFNGLTEELLHELKKRNIALIEDVCESHGATHIGKKLGNFGLMSNFSYYYAHHMSTIEGGMISTNDEKIYQILRMCRSHGMVREANNEELKTQYKTEYPDLLPDFIFAYPAYNVRNTELGAVLGRNQLLRLDSNNVLRRENFSLFLKHLDPQKYFTDFQLEGSSNYAFNLVLKTPDHAFCERVMQRLRDCKVEFRRGSAGGGNQLRQPYLRSILPKDFYKKFPVTEHIHFFGFYIGNYPELAKEKIISLCNILNEVK